MKNRSKLKNYTQDFFLSYFFQRFYFLTGVEVGLLSHSSSPLLRTGCSRWKIENETFHTLKNQRYNFEHNYGHGYQNLCSVMTMLMNLEFFIDQVPKSASREKRMGSLVSERGIGSKFLRVLVDLGPTRPNQSVGDQ